MREYKIAAIPAVGIGPEVIAAGLQALEALARGVAEADLAAAPVVLPDFHHKHDMEMPSSIAVATRGTIRPAFTSAYFAGAYSPH